ncbi:baeRF12 domain-containing protein [Azospirillum sp. sgz301742]
MRRHRKVWIVMAGGAGVRILQHRTWEPGCFEDLPIEDLGAARQPVCEPAGDRPGSPASEWRNASQGVAVRPEHRIADLVNRAATQGLFDGLVLVAPPPMLSTLKRALEPAAAERMIREEAKDLLGVSAAALPARLLAMLRR